MDNQASVQETIARIRGARFRITRWDGYDEREVDTFLDELIAALGRGERPGPETVPVFTSRRMRPAYRKADVDGFLEGLVG
ncbi:MAG: DivIVA domain-containing protein [Trebonia sp.]